TAPPPVTVTTTTVQAPTAPAPAPAPLPAPLPVLAEVPGAATVLIGLVNADRAAAGLVPLQLRDDISAFSSAHAKAMAEAGDIWHNDEFFTSATKRRFGARRVGENVARHSGLQAAHLLLMGSPGHRANILDPGFRAVGLAAWTKGGTIFVAQNFIEPVSGDGSAPASQAPAAKPAAAPKPPASPTTAAAAKPAGAPAPAPAVLAVAPAAADAGEPQAPLGTTEVEADGPLPAPAVQAAGTPVASTDSRRHPAPPVMAAVLLVAVIVWLGRRVRLAG
ncbi:MAG: CAP domain-containing protein, partial [Actinobacteria bacterium]|nr:CAP domain-containing protein [Actinomycetota bacterium]